MVYWGLSLVLRPLPLGVGQDEVSRQGAPSIAPRSYCISVVVVGHTVA